MTSQEPVLWGNFYNLLFVPKVPQISQWVQCAGHLVGSLTRKHSFPRIWEIFLKYFVDPLLSVFCFLVCNFNHSYVVALKWVLSFYLSVIFHFSLFVLLSGRFLQLKLSNPSIVFFRSAVMVLIHGFLFFFFAPYLCCVEWIPSISLRIWILCVWF